jgi:hypothetical protein
MNGIVFLEPVKDSPMDAMGHRHYIHVPHVLLRSSNQYLGDVPNEYLDPFRIVDDSTFERAMNGG